MTIMKLSLPLSLTHRSGALHVGDRLLSINGQQLDQRPVQEARRLLAHSDISVKLEIMPAHNFSEQPGISPVDDAQSDISSRASQSTSFAGSENQRRPSQCEEPPSNLILIA